MQNGGMNVRIFCEKPSWATIILLSFNLPIQNSLDLNAFIRQYKIIFTCKKFSPQVFCLVFWILYSKQHQCQLSFPNSAHHLEICCLKSFIEILYINLPINWCLFFKWRNFSCMYFIELSPLRIRSSSWIIFKTECPTAAATDSHIYCNSNSIRKNTKNNAKITNVITPWFGIVFGYFPRRDDGRQGISIGHSFSNGQNVGHCILGLECPKLRTTATKSKLDFICYY